MVSTTITKSQPAPQAAKEKPRQQWWLVGLQVICFFVIAILLLEGYFRLAGVGSSEYLQPDLQLGSKHILDKLVIWRAEGFSNNKMNSVGLRDTEHTINKKPGVFRIALLGDSVVEALQVDLNDTFGKLLERQLNSSNKKQPFEIINFGCSGYSTGQEYLQYQNEGIKYKPDAVVLFYNRGDSMESVVNAKNRKIAEPRPYFYIDQSGQLKEDDSILEANYNKLKPDVIRSWLRKNSAIFGALSQADFNLTLNEPLYRKLKGWWNSLVKFASGEHGRTHICFGFSGKPARHIHMPHGRCARPYESTGALQTVGARVNAPAANALAVGAIDSHKRPDYPDQDELAVTKALITKLAQQAADNGQKFILVIYPNIDKFAELTKQAKELKALASENRFDYLDLTPAFLSDPNPRSNFALYHFNRKGHITVTNQLAKLF